MLLGEVVSITKGAINSEVGLKLDNDMTMYAIVTNESVQALNLAPGKTASALIKSSWVILTSANEKLITSARNQLCGVVSRIKQGTVNTEVILDLGGNTSIVAMITNESQRLFKFYVGSPACALIKASHVILAVTE
jgi:molybdate transport system regulatory protein